VWGEDDNVLVSSSYMPTGKVKRVEGGFQFSGRWGFSSGSDHCDWAFLGGFVPPEREGDLPEMRTFLVPKSDYTLLDDWHTSGLKATGSKTVVIDDCFVPDYRTHKMSDGFRCVSPGHAVNDAPLYKLPFGQIFTRSVATPAIGMALGAIEAYKEVTGKRVGRADGQKVAMDPQSQEVCALAAIAVDEARTMLNRDYEEIMEYAISGESIDMETRVRWRYNSSVATTKSVQAVDDLFTTSGGGAIFLESSINRFFQDVHAARGHYANNPHKSGRNYGGVMLGMKTTDWFI
jgi:3-hydroxy-9,10-secoandrosta-1,3,5(10)-triene-9,17-dione monooxygenase